MGIGRSTIFIGLIITSSIVSGIESQLDASLKSNSILSLNKLSSITGSPQQVIYDSIHQISKDNTYINSKVGSSRKLSSLQSQHRLRGSQTSPPAVSSGSNTEESLKLLQQMEALKMQLEALVNKKDGTTATTSVGQQPQQMYTQQKPQYVPERASSSRPASIGGKCGGGDAFAGQPVDGWNPPAQARLEDIQQWEDARREVSSIITHFNRGGKPLRELIHKEVSALKLLRQKLFCQYM